MQLYLIAAVIPVLLATAWLYTAHVTNSYFPKFRNKRICLLIAHPDDEAMFFAPTILALTNPKLGNHVKILCLSTGNADNLGQTRTQELITSATTLGLRSPDDVFVLDSPAFPDSMTATWNATAVAGVLSAAFAPDSSSPASQLKNNSNLDKPPVATIDILLTFDSKGISSHPNHTSLYRGARSWLSALMADKSGWACPVELYTLTTTNLLRKYMSFLDAPVTMLTGVLGAVGGKDASKVAGGEKVPPSRILFVNDFMQLRKAQRAMTMGHKSQMRWFRWGWIGVGRYMVVNDLKRQKII